MALEDAKNTVIKRKQLSTFVRGQIVGMHLLKGKVSQILVILNTPTSTVKYVIHLYEKKRVEVPPQRSGRPKVFSDRTKSAFTGSFCTAFFMPITTQHQLFIAGRMEMSYSTFRRRIQDLGFYQLPWVHLKIPFLSSYQNQYHHGHKNSIFGKVN